MAERKRRLWVLPLIFLVAAAAILWRDDQEGLRVLLDLRAQVRDARARVDELGMKAARPEREAEALQNDDLAIEGAARTGLGMVRPGEIVVRLDPAEGR
jgi:cell division protein FtsB